MKESVEVTKFYERCAKDLQDFANKQLTKADKFGVFVNDLENEVKIAEDSILFWKSEAEYAMGMVKDFQLKLKENKESLKVMKAQLKKM